MIHRKRCQGCGLTSYCRRRRCKECGKMLCPFCTKEHAEKPVSVE